MPEVTVYSRPSCAPCATLKYYLTKKGIAYSEKPAEDSMMQVPVVIVGDMRVDGLNLPYMAELLGV